MEWCKSRGRPSEVVQAELTAADIAKAETLWIKEMQKDLLL